MKLTDLFNLLNKNGLADQVHYRNKNQIIFYHWNKSMSDLVPSLTLENNCIEKIHYPRIVMPQVYALVEKTFEDDFDFDEHKFLRDKRG